MWAKKYPEDSSGLNYSQPLNWVFPVDSTYILALSEIFTHRIYRNSTIMYYILTKFRIVTYNTSCHQNSIKLKKSRISSCLTKVPCPQSNEHSDCPYNHYHQGGSPGPRGGGEERLEWGILHQVWCHQLLRLETKKTKVSSLGTAISLWFTVGIYTLRNSKGREMSLMMTDISDYLGLSFIMFTSNPIFSLLSVDKRILLFYHVQFSAALVSKSQALQDHSKTIRNSHWEYRGGYNSPALPRCQ